jgi:signal transduction histidine kinase
MELHPLLKRQLKRLDMDVNYQPTPQQWAAFLQTLQRTYTEADQERYLLERSMQISTEETQELNAKLEHAQHIAKMGYWQYEKTNDILSFSKEMYVLLGSLPDEYTPTLKNFMICFNVDDRICFSELVERAFKEGHDFEMEAHITTLLGEKRWYFFAGKPHLTKDVAIHLLSGIVMDITERKDAEKELFKLNHQLISSARKAGMSEVATSMLHNVGNTLNSVNISINLIKNCFDQLDFNTIYQATEMLLTHAETLADFLKTDPKGQLLPRFFTESKTHTIEIYQDLNAEIARLLDNIKHIENIVNLQGALSGSSSLVEKVSAHDLIFSALEITQECLNKSNILVYHEISNPLNLHTDKNKLLQILVNLIQNAKDAVLENTNVSKKEIKIFCKHLPHTDKISISIEDNGVGITENMLTKIFSFGFTTKTAGHGFGLHISALLAKELGGSLKVESEGLGRGSRFILNLPLHIPAKSGATYAANL